MDQQLRSLIETVRQRWLRVVTAQVIARAAVCAAVPLVAAAVAYRVAAPGGWALLSLAALALATTGAVAAVAAWRRPSRPHDRQVARFIEERTAGATGARPLEDALVSAVDVAAAPEADLRRQFLPVIAATLARQLEDLTPASIVSPESVRRATTRAAGGAVVFVAALIVALPLLEQAAADARLRLFASPAAGTSAGAATTRRGAPPRVRRIDVRYAYPAFSGLGPKTEEDGGDVYGPAGTKVTLRVFSDKPVTAGSLRTASASTLPLRVADGGALESTFVLSGDDSYRVKLTDADGLESAADTEYFIRLMEDGPPSVRILRPSSDRQITPLEEVAIEARADDDYGIAAFDLVYGVAGGPEKVARFDRVTGTNTQKIGVHLLPAEALGVTPGDVITYYARARDVARAKPSTQATSDIYFLEVKPFNEEFSMAESQASSAPGSGDLESLIQAQKEIISATWNLERRAQAGRSAADLQAVAEAQAELKTRAERLSRRSSGLSGGGPLPQRQLPGRGQGARGGSGDSIGAALEAMSRAVVQLQGQKTRDAIPHEMAALNGLLQAQAEVRRRQVTTGSSGSGNGSSRAGQDLSALFDKELQRQQRTNYENRTSATAQQEPPGNDSALDRIRDLARRQEDLNRRQQELASAGLSAEEMRRQLEKLTREQMELRRQTEELSRTTPPATSGQAGSGGMRQASEQMRSAASELRRDDPARAAENGQRAADELRRMERRLGGGRGDARDRSSEVQLEAQQIAQEQRRIAAESERLEKSGAGAAADAKRRLASDKERLAGRVEDLQRSAQQSARGSMPDAAASLAEAARDLERERIAERMRESAKRMQAPGGQQPGQAAEDRKIARTLDSVAEKLGGSASAGSKQLSQQLDRTREIRDRLNRLEQQMRDAAAREQSKGPAQPGSRSPQGERGRQGRDATQGSRGTSGSGQAGSELQRLQAEYQRELQRARDALDRLGKGQQRTGLDMATPEEQEFSRSAPGTEAFKQDRSGWESLRKDVDLALEKHEAAISDRLAGRQAQDRLSAGGSERVPESYRSVIARYYESLARVKK
ncbi:MAG: hypothetical protein A3H96_22800 [Acidobacteria bacterium RIFCSPLOWO2_02_FULL_67_36]|nr:MAG: hypothetical protein A3H96_22800 [Acidobacteria bacterium RIFCSPLOWO2_02_FULL_67_36]OFW26364.1 MAG: hypothetical protein A3G21_27135 [Acidobacteria bacterium RIFCSPLOWO2_12_FULL_66_21]